MRDFFEVFFRLSFLTTFFDDFFTEDFLTLNLSIVASFENWRPFDHV